MLRTLWFRARGSPVARVSKIGQRAPLCAAKHRRIGFLGGGDSLSERVVGGSGVDLSGGNLPVPQRPLHQVQVTGFLVEASGKRMP